MSDCECATCPNCDGWGYVYSSAPDEHGFPQDKEEQISETEDCEQCDGTGVDRYYTGCDC